MMKQLIFLLLIPILGYTQSTVSYNIKGLEELERKNYYEAIDHFEKAIEEGVEIDTAYYNRGVTYQRLGELKEALADYIKAADLTSDPILKIKALNNAALIQRNATKDLVSALENTEKILVIDSLHFGALYIRGLVFHDLERYDEALNNLDKAIGLNPKNPDPYYDRAIVKRKIGKIRQAIEDYTKVIELAPNYTRAYNNRGYAKMLINDFAGAKADYSKAIKLDGSAYAYNNRGFANFKLGDLKSARMDCEKSLEIDPENGWAYHYLGLIYYDLGKKSKACNLFQIAVDLGKEDASEDIQEKCQ